MSRDDGGPVFPRVGERDDGDTAPHARAQSGMSLRDYFAAAALQGYLAGQWRPEEFKADAAIEPATFAQRAYYFADALLAARAK